MVTISVAQQGTSYNNVFDEIKQNREDINKNLTTLLDNRTKAKQAIDEYNAQIIKLRNENLSGPASVAGKISQREQLLGSPEARFAEKKRASQFGEQKIKTEEEIRAAIRSTEEYINSTATTQAEIDKALEDIKKYEDEIRNYQQQGYMVISDGGQYKFIKYETAPVPEQPVSQPASQPTASTIPNWKYGPDSDTAVQPTPLPPEQVALPPVIYSALQRSQIGRSALASGKFTEKEKTSLQLLSEFRKLDAKEQERIITESYGTDMTSQVMKGHIPKIVLQNDRIRQYIKKYHPEIKSEAGLSQEAVLKLKREAVRYLLYEDRVDPYGAQSRVYAGVSDIERILDTYKKGVASIGAATVSAPEFIFEEGGGRLYHGITGSLWNIQHKKSLDYNWDKSFNKPFTTGIFKGYSPRAWIEKEVSPSLVGIGGGVGTTFSAVTREYEMRTGAWTTEKEKQYQYQLSLAKKYPIEFAFGTFGELLGMKTVGGISKSGKELGSRGFQYATTKTIGKPILPSALGPTNIARTIKYKILKSQGKVKYTQPELVFQKEALIGETTYGQKPFFEGLKEFEKTKGMSGPDRYSVVHTSPSPLSYMRRGFKAGGSKSESPGISTSPRGSAVPQFFQLEPGLESGSRPALLPRVKLPTVSDISIGKIVRLPKKSRDYKASAKLMKNQPKGDYGVVAPKMELGRYSLAEPEVILWKGTKGTGKEISEYTSYKGHTIPLVKYSTFDQPIRPSWMVGRVFKGMTRSYEQYLSSSESIIKNFRKTATAEAKAVFKTSSKHEMPITGKMAQSIKNYKNALKEIDRLAKEQQFRVDEWQQPTVAGQLKLKGFKDLSDVLKEKTKEVLVGKPDVKTYTPYKYVFRARPITKKTYEQDERYKQPSTPKYSYESNKPYTHYYKEKPYSTPEKQYEKTYKTEGSYKYSSRQYYSKKYESEKPYRPYYPYSYPSRSRRTRIIPPPILGESSLDKKKLRKQKEVRLKSGYRERKFQIGSLLFEPIKTKVK